MDMKGLCKEEAEKKEVEEKVEGKIKESEGESEQVEGRQRRN